jgi:tetratricopeptide (TPR) repeat protein
MKKFFIVTIIILSGLNSPWAEMDKSSLWESFLKGEYENIIETTKEVFRRMPEEKIAAEIYYLRAMSFLGLGQTGFARKYFHELLERYPACEWRESAKLALGDCFLLEQEWDKAGLAYQDFVEKNPRSGLLSLAYFKIAETKRKAGVWDEARAAHQKVKEAFPESLEASVSSEILSHDEFYFTFQVGSFINRDNARELMQKLNETGFTAYVTESVKLGQVFYRVRVGRFASRQESEETKERLIRAGYTARLYP